MKKLLSLAMLGVFCAAVVGCHASADVDSPDNDMDHHTTYKKTEYKTNGDTKTTKTEVRHEND